MARETVLVIEDDPRILRFVQSGLKLAGYKHLSATDGKTGLEMARNQEPSIIILDIGLPVMDGWEVLQELRSFSNVPVIILSAKDEDIDKVKGLKLGADDYLAKPFNPDELLARIEAVMRRTKGEAIPVPGTFHLGDITIDFKKHTIGAGGNPTSITRLEGVLLSYLVGNSGRVVTYEEILSRVWGAEYRNDVQLLRTAINRIRSKFGDNSEAKALIRNVPRVGYMLDAPSD